MSGDSHPYVPIHDEEPVDEANQSYNNFRITDEPPFSSRRINQNNNKNRCYNFLSSKYFLFGILLVLIVFMIAMGYLLFQKLDTEIIELKAELSSYRSQTDRNFIALTTNLDNFKDKENDFEVLATKKIVDTNKIFQTQNKTLSGNINRIFSTIELHQKELDRLSNGTSNADVLDQLRATKKAVDNDLDDALSKVDKRLRKNADEIEKTEVQIKEDLDNAMDRMKLVVEKSTNHIKDIQQNVTNELDFMSVKLVATVQELNKEVNTAKGIIQSEVADVKGNIEQYVIVTNKQFAAENDFVKYQLAGTFTLLGILIFLWHMTSHLRHYQNPEVQRRIMAVLWMVPIYGFTSWLSLVFPKKEQYFGIVRDAYEAYAVYTFIGLLIAVLAEGKGLPHVVERIKHHVITEREAVIEAKKVGLRNLPKEHIKPPFPCCYRNNQPREVASAWLYQCQMMAMQFVYSKPLLTVIPLLLKVTGAYRNDIPAYSDNTIHWDSMQLYIMLAQNVSVFIAFYGLLSFYHGTEKDLEWCDPWPKFLCIKGVVFATFWQSVGIQFMSSMGLVDERTAVQIQNLLICIEMLLASLAHFYIFPYQEWQIGYQKQRETGIRLRDTLAISDFVKDMGHMVTRWDHHQDPNASTELLIRLDEKGDVELGEVKVDDHLFNRDIVHSIDSEMNGDGGLIRENDGKHLIESSPLLGAAAPSYSSMVPILSTELNESSFSNNRIGSVSNDDLKYSKSENEFLINVLPDGGSEAYVGQNFMPAAVFDSAEQPDQGELMVHSVSSDEGEHAIQENSDSSDQYQSTGTQDTPTEWFEVYQSPRKEDSFFSRGESKNSTIEETTTNSGISLINNNSSHGLHLESLSSIAEVASESTPKEASLNCSEVEEVDTASSVPKQPRGGKDNLHEDDEVADV